MSRVVALTVIAPITAGREDELQRRLDSLQTGAGSPFAQIRGLHFGRFTIIEELERVDGRPYPPGEKFLLLAVDVDPPEQAALVAIAAHCGELLRFCEGCPEPSDGRAFDSWIEDHRVRDGFTVMPYGDSTLGDVQRAVRLREQVAAFALESAALEPADLHARFIELIAEAPL